MGGRKGNERGRVEGKVREEREKERNKLMIKRRPPKTYTTLKEEEKVTSEEGQPTQRKRLERKDR